MFKNELNWAAKKTLFTGAFLIKDSPWGQIIKLEVAKKKYLYLKIETNKNSSDYLIIPVIHRHFPENIPHQIFRNIKLKCQILDDFTEKGFRKHKPEEILHVYQKIQKTILRDQLPFIQIFNSKKSLFTLIKRTDCSDSASRFIRFIGRNNLKKYHELLTSKENNLAGYLSLANRLPTVLCHNDLHLQNTIVNKNNEVIIYDWSDSIFAPLGTCLSSLIGPLNLFNIFITGSKKKIKIRNTIMSYLESFCAGDVADKQFLHSLIAASLGGSINSLLLLLESPKIPREFIPFYKAHFEKVFNEISQIINHNLTRDFLKSNIHSLY